MRKHLKTALLASLFIGGAVISPETGFASEGGEDGGSQLVDLGWRVVNFAIFVAIVYFAAAKPIKKLLNDRIEGIKKALSDAEKGKEEAERKLKGYVGKLASLEDEVKEIHSTLRKEGEVERDRIIEAAEEAAEKIKIQAGFSATQELNKAIAAIKKEAANTAVALAEKMLKRDLGKNDQKRLVSEFLGSLGDMK